MTTEETGPSPELTETKRKFARALGCFFNRTEHVHGGVNAEIIWSEPTQTTHQDRFVENVQGRINHDDQENQSFLIRGKWNELFQCEAEHQVDDYWLTMIRPADVALETGEVVVEDQVIALAIVRRPAPGA